jgi:hypothetical protein
MQEFGKPQKGYFDMDNHSAIRELTAAEIEAVGGGVDDEPKLPTSTGPTFPKPPER